jgi:sulfite reductase (ferredoxin)
MACHLAGACPHEKLDVTPWAEATFRHFVRNPIGQRLPRKFKVNFSGCSTDCGQAMFNDFGVVATTRTNEDGTVEPGFRVYIAGGLGATPHPALALEDFTSREDLLPTIEATLRVFDQTGNRDNKLACTFEVGCRSTWYRRSSSSRASKFVTHSPLRQHGQVEFHQKLFLLATRQQALQQVVKSHTVGQGVRVDLKSNDPFKRWVQTSVIRGTANGSVSAIAYAALGDITADQFTALAKIQRD